MRHGGSTSGTARELTTAERDLLDAILDVDGLEGAESLGRQASVAQASPSCGCGCGSIYLVVNDEGTTADDVSLPVVEGDVLDEDGEVVGGLLLFVIKGRLHNLEVYAFGDDPLPLPSPERARLRCYRD